MLIEQPVWRLQQAIVIFLRLGQQFQRLGIRFLRKRMIANLVLQIIAGRTEVACTGRSLHQCAKFIDVAADFTLGDLQLFGCGLQVGIWPMIRFARAP